MTLPESFAEGVWIRQTVGFAGITCLVYDYFLTISEEVECIWKAPWTMTKVMFLLSRYGNLLGQSLMYVMDTKSIAHSSVHFCEIYNIFYSIFILISAESIHILVLLRAWAIWGCQRRMAAVLISLYVGYLLLMLAMVAFGFNTEDFRGFQYIDFFRVCIGTMPPYVWTSFAASFLLDTVVFGLTMWSLRQHLKESRCLYPSSLVYILIRDAVIFYVVSTFYNGFTVVCWTIYAADPRYILQTTFALPILSIAGQRLVLNLRRTTVRSYSPRSLSAEIDRQIHGFQAAEPSWWKSVDESGHRADVEVGSSDKELCDGLETVGMVMMENEAEAGMDEGAGMPEGNWEGDRLGRE